jgi:hypothetical protein
MTSALALLLGAALSAASGELDNLDFARGRLAGWQGKGFAVKPAAGAGAGRSFVVTSKAEGGDRTGLLHRTLVIPAGAGTIHFTASVSGAQPDERLDIYLEAAEREIIPKLVRTATGYQKAPLLLPPLAGQPREYVWQVAGRAGQTVRIVLVDRHPTPGHHVVSSGFRVRPVDWFEGCEFSRLMNNLAREHRLARMGPRLRSDHFLAVSNTEEDFTRLQLQRCELLRSRFLSHFRRKGFALKAPSQRLMVALFDGQEGVEAYIGQRLPAAIAGLYHPESNRLVIYDYARNRGLLQHKEAARKFAGQLRTDLEKQLVLGTVERRAGEVRADANVATIMHEAAHQMSFNTGLLNRDGDQPLWLSEGLATYCEATDQGHWKGIGALNPERLRPLAAALAGRLKLLPLRTLVESDRWLRGPGGNRNAMIGYAQCWALFRMLMDEQPAALRRYCELIYPRRTSEHRLADFVQVFGADLAKLDQRHRAYIKRVVEASR